MTSTENLLAPLRGKYGIFLGYKDGCLGGTILPEVFGKDLLVLVEEIEGVSIADSPDDLADKVREIATSSGKLDVPAQAGNSTARMLEHILK